MSSNLAIINNTEIVINIYINIMRKGLWTCQQDGKLLELLSHEQDQNQSSYTPFFSFALSNSIAQASDYRLDLKSLAITQRQVQIRFLDSTHAHTHVLWIHSPCMQSQQELRAALQSMLSTLQDVALYPYLTPCSWLVLFLSVLLIMFLCNNKYCPNPTNAYCHLSLKSCTACITKLLNVVSISYIISFRN